MIEFPCHCGYRFSLSEEMAGGLIQCPDCGRLNDIPSLSDLENLTAEGTFKVDDSPLREERLRMQRLREAFARRTRDDSGGEIDLRPSLAELRRVGNDPGQGSGGPGTAARGRPKYDPQTGELIRAIEVNIPAPPPAVPMARRAMDYAAEAPPRGQRPWGVLIELLMPVNVVVMFFVLLAYFVAQIAAYSLLGFFVTLAIIGILMAHYAATIEETGPEARDELPRLLRDFGFGQDIWWPFCQAFGALMVTFWPAAVCVLQWNPRGGGTWQLAALVLLVAGMIPFPAILLTFTTSGAALANLRPDRVIGVMRVAGGSYLLATITWFAVAGLTVWNTVGLWLIPGLVRRQPWLWNLNHPAVVYPLIALSIYLTHWFCWQLGLIYRRHHDEFAWAYQRHVPVNRIATLPEQARAARH